MYELRLQVSPTGGHLDLEFAQVFAHPPRFEIIDGQLRGVAVRTRIETGTFRGGSRSELDAWRADPASVPPLLESVLSGSPAAEFADRVSPPEPHGPLPEDVGRIVVSASEELVSLPWEEVPNRMGLRDVALLREVRSAQPFPVRPMGFPIGLSVVYDAPPPEELLAGGTSTWPEVLFDEFVQFGLPDGIVREARPEEATLWHLIASETGVAMGMLREWSPPRAVIVSIDRESSEREMAAVAASALDRGALAAIVTRVPIRAFPSFFQPFYRKLFHNWPLEFCIWAGRSAADLPLEAVQISVRPEGELAMALTRIPGELAIAGSVALPSPERDVPPWTSPRASVIERHAPDRERRATREVLQSVESQLRTRRLDAGTAIMADLEHLMFGAEEHDAVVVRDAAASLSNSLADEMATLEEIDAAGPPLRRTTVTVDDPETAKPLEPNRALSLGTTHTMRVAIEPAPGQAQVSVEFDETKLAEFFETHDRLDLDVVVFAPESEFSLPENRARLSLPRVGATDPPAEFQITPLHEGWCRLRVAIYYRNALLQSLALSAFAAADGFAGDVAPTIRRALDWAASTDLLVLDELSAPAFTVLTNQGNDGSHWMGVFGTSEGTRLPLQSGQMRTFDNLDITNRGKQIRSAMERVQGKKPPAGANERLVAFGAEALVDLARVGYQVYHHFFESPMDTRAERLGAFRKAVAAADHGIISVARVDGTWTLPWAALYDKYVDVNRTQGFHVCQVFQDQLAANVWGDDGELAQQADLLDQPAACQAQADCPLKREDEEEITVCPFGFWGLRHQIEQPLQHLEVAPVSDQIPEEMRTATFSQQSVIARSPSAPIRIGTGIYPFSVANRHRRELESIAGVSVDWKDVRSDVMDLLYSEEGHHLFYFFCHGHADGQDFSLEVGPKGGAQNKISTAAIRGDKVHWAKPGTPQPLVLLMACESAAIKPEIAGDFFRKMKNTGAAGLIGSEIAIGTRLGSDSGQRLVSALASGASVGEAFLDMRRNLLRRHDPLGLVLTSYAPATLHICDDPAGGGRCARFHRPRE